MNLFSFFLIYYSRSLTLNDIAFGLWTGEEMFDERISSMSKTWLQLIPEVHIYSDEIPLNSSKSITDSSNHLNIIFHQIPMQSHHLIGTKFKGKWNSVQSRHLFAIIDLYKNHPNYTWYVFGDDDTFLFPDGLLSFLSTQDPDIPQIFGHSFYVFEHINKFFPNPEIPHAFAQGGAGVLLSRKIMSMIYPYLPMCAEIYTGVNFASDMRLSACIQRFLNMSNDVFHLLPLLHGDVPYKSHTKPDFQSKPITFHHIVPPLTQRLWHSSYTTWTSNDTTELYLDWNSIALTELYIPLEPSGSLVEIQWGFCIYLDENRQTRIHSLSQPEPIFDSTDKEHLHPKRFVQHYEKGIAMHMICDDTLDDHNLIFDSFLLDEDGCTFRVKCPEPRHFLHNYPDGKSPLVIVEQEEIEL